MKTAYSYCRVSSNPQERGDGIRRQVAGSKALALKHGWTLSDQTLHDLGVSGFHGKNWREGELAGFLEAIRKGAVKKGSVLIVESLDRISRDDLVEALPLFLGIIKSGVDIATCNPERIYDGRAMQDSYPIMEALFTFIRANEESKIKSIRISAAWSEKRKQIQDRKGGAWEEKRNQLQGGKKLSAQCPAWLDLSADKMNFSFNDGAKIIKRICMMAIDGHGATAICKQLNKEEIPSIGRSSRSNAWHKSYIKKIIHNKALIGEYQPFMGHNNRKPIGDPIPDYFPRLISDKDFYRMQTLTRSKPGRTSPSTPNIFSGLLFDLTDGQTLTLVNKGDKRLVNSAAQRGIKGAVYCSFPYAVFERVFLCNYLPEIKECDIAPVMPEGIDTSDLSNQLPDLDYRIGTIKKRLATDTDFDQLLDILQDLTRKRKLIQSQLEILTEKNNQEQIADTLKECKQLCNRLNDEDDRRRLKANIKRIIERIDIQIESKGLVRVARVKMTFYNGKSRTFVIVIKRGQYWHRWTDGDKTETMEEYFAWSVNVNIK